MPSKQITLDVAAFLDSPEARALKDSDRGLDQGDVQPIIEIFVELCYDGVGKQPRLLDGQDVHSVLGHLMPGRLKRKDPRAEHVPAILRAYFDYLETAQVVTQIYEIRRGLESTASEFLETVRSGENPHHAGPKQAPFVHGAEKLGRNDPCSCGSGKKFKKCHGKGA